MMWVVIWTALACLLVAMEFWAQSDRVKGNTLTSYMRHQFLRSVYGSTLVGGLLVWLVWHWLFVSGGTDWGDAIAILVGMTAGLLGYVLRQRDTFT